METCGKILKFADVSEEIDVNILDLLINQMEQSKVSFETDRFLEAARFDCPEGILRVIIELAQTKKEINWFTSGEGTVLSMFISFVNMSSKFKRQRKIWRNTKGYEILSQPNVLLPLFYSSKQQPSLSIEALLLLTHVDLKLQFLTPDFVYQFVCRVRTILDYSNQVASQISNSEMLVQSLIKPIQQVAKLILESEHSYLFRKLLHQLPSAEKEKIIGTENDLSFVRSDGKSVKSIMVCEMEPTWNKMKCANCQKQEKTNREFKKCSGCLLVYYCNRCCQRSHWKTHKKFCKRNQQK